MPQAAAQASCQRAEDSSTGRLCPDPATPYGAAHDPDLASAQHIAPPSEILDPPTSQRTPTQSNTSSTYPSPRKCPSPASADARSPDVGLEGQTRSAFGLSPLPEGTPPLPSKLVAKAAKEMDAWRGDVQQMRAELTKTYR